MYAPSPYQRPMAFRDMLNDMFRLYRANIGPFLVIVAPVLLPVMLLQILLTTSLQHSMFTAIQPTMQAPTGTPPIPPNMIGANLWLYVPLLALLFVIDSVALPLMYGTVILATVQRLQDSAISILDACRSSGRHLLTLVTAAAIGAVVLVLCIIIARLLLARSPATLFFLQLT